MKTYQRLDAGQNCAHIICRGPQKTFKLLQNLSENFSNSIKPDHCQIISLLKGHLNIKILPFLCFQYTEADVATFRNVGMEHLGDKFDKRWLKGIVFGELQRHLEDPILKLSKFLI